MNDVYSEHFRWLLKEALDELTHLNRRLFDVDLRLSEYVRPHVELIRRAYTIPDMRFTMPTTILAEIGLDMSRFPDAHPLASRPVRLAAMRVLQ